MRLTSIKLQLALFLGLFALYLYTISKEAGFLLGLATAVISAVVADSLFLGLKEKKFLITESSVISGLIIGFVVSGDQPWWVFSLASFLAIGSKYLIRINKRHLFNPAAFGIFLVTLFFGASCAWQGTYLWYILAPFGFYFAWKAQKIEIIIGYALVFLVLFGAQAIIQKTNLWNIFGYLSYFYIFVMVIEPKTTPVKKVAKLIFGMLVALLIFLLTEAGARFDAELCALLVANITVPALNRVPAFNQ